MCSKCVMSVAAIMAAVVACGCGDPASRSSPPVVVRLVDHAEIEAERLRHRGQVVVLDCWSTSCPPCVKEFPGLLALERTFGEKVACISLSFDYEGIGPPEAVVPRVEGFLRQVNAAAITNLVSREDADTLSKRMGLDSVPAVYVWKQDGSLAQRFDDDFAAKELGRPFTYADVERVVRDCLGR